METAVHGAWVWASTHLASAAKSKLLSSTALLTWRPRCDQAPAEPAADTLPSCLTPRARCFLCPYSPSCRELRSSWKLGFRHPAFSETPTAAPRATATAAKGMKGSTAPTMSNTAAAQGRPGLQSGSPQTRHGL